MNETITNIYTNTAKIPSLRSLFTFKKWVEFSFEDYNAMKEQLVAEYLIKQGDETK